MKNGWGVAAGLGIAGLLVAGDARLGDGRESTGVATETARTTGHDLGLDRLDERHDDGRRRSGSTGTSSDSTYGGTAGSTAIGPSTRRRPRRRRCGKNEVTGKVEKFDKTSKELTLRTAQEAQVSDSTQVTKDGQSASLTDIKEGDQVRASFSGSGDTLQVTQIEVMTKGSTGSTARAPAPRPARARTGSYGTTGSSSAPAARPARARPARPAQARPARARAARPRLQRASGTSDVPEAGEGRAGLGLPPFVVFTGGRAPLTPRPVALPRGASPARRSPRAPSPCRARAPGG